MASEAHLRHALEPPGVHVGGVLITACASLVLVGIAVGGLDLLYRAYVPDPAPPPPQAFPQPRVQPDESKELRRLLSEQHERLTGYAWADRQKGFVRIPIERAMQLIVQKGAQAYDPLEPAAPALSGPSAGAQRAITAGQGAPAGPSSPPAPATNGEAPASRHQEPRP